MKKPTTTREIYDSSRDMLNRDGSIRLWHENNNKTTEEKTEMKDNSFPDFDFKIRNGDDPRIRQWLKDNGCAWISEANIVTAHSHCHFLYVRGTSVSGCAERYKFEAIDYPELEIKFKIVVDWEEIKPHNPLKDQLEDLRKQQEEIAKQMKELEEKIK